MSEQQSSYRQILKATSIFGSVQVFSILISIIRSKIIAVLLGPIGIGVEGLFNSTIGLISGITNFGLETSSIKNVAAANSTGDKIKIATIVTVLRRLVWLTGLIGFITMIILSQSLSRLAFGNNNYTIGFVWVSITLLLNQISTGQIVLLRGMRKIKLMARSSMTGSLLGLIVSVPIYYIWGVDGIVPAIIATSLVALLRTWYFARKVEIDSVEINFKTLVYEGREMLFMGFMFSLSGVFVLAKSYGLRVIISNLGGLEQVGLYTAGFTIINKYISVVFSAMATDYFPKLSSISSNNDESVKLINHQSEMALLILAPILSLFIISASWIITLIYSRNFNPIYAMLQWSALGIYFKTISWSVVYLFLAKGNSRLYLINEVTAGIITLIIQIIGFLLGGLTGMGIGYMIGFIYYTIQVYFVSKKVYGFNFKKEVILILLIQLLLGIVCFLIVSFIPRPWSFFTGFIIVGISCYITIIELNKRINLISIVKNRFKL